MTADKVGDDINGNLVLIKLKLHPTKLTRVVTLSIITNLVNLVSLKRTSQNKKQIRSNKTKQQQQQHKKNNYKTNKH